VIAALAIVASLAAAGTPSVRFVPPGRTNLTLGVRSGSVEATPAVARDLADQGLDVGDSLVDGRLPIVLHGRADRRALRAAGLTFNPAPRATARASAALPSGRTSYRDLADYEADLDRMVARHPTLARKVVIGTSVQGRPISGVEIATGVGRTDDGRPTHVELGLHHAREWSSGEVVVEYGLDLLAGYGKDKRITELVEHERTFLFPVINPDGFVISRTVNPLQRKNAAGVDLNRNYGAFWGGPGASDFPAMDTYRGPAPFSEPESRAFHDWSADHQVMVVNSNHNYGGTVLYQPGFRRTDEPGLPRDSALPGARAFAAVARSMADAAGYDAGPAFGLYDATGATEDWNYFAQGAFGYTTEVGFDDFQPDYQDAVVDQYLGTRDGPLNHARRPADGLRETFLRAGEAALSLRTHGVITGIAPPGATLTLSRDVALTTSYVLTGTDAPITQTGPAQPLPEHLETTLTVPRSGVYRWHVNPSTPPLVALAHNTQPWTLECGPDSKPVLVDRGETVRGDVQCGATTALTIVRTKRRSAKTVVVVRVAGTPVRALRASAGGPAVIRRLASGRVRLVLEGRGALRVRARTPNGSVVRP
jgi:hypothetical protein